MKVKMKFYVTKTKRYVLYCKKLLMVTLLTDLRKNTLKHV